MPRIKNDAIVIVDVESTCWGGNPPSGQRSEIIEIGVCLLAARNLDVRDFTSIVVKPSASTVSDFCTELTGITQEEVDGGVSMAAACLTLRDRFGCKDRAWGSYGDYDKNQFARNCSELGIQYPFSDRHINIKWLLALSKGWDKEVGMDTALTKLGMDLQGSHHRAGDDTKNITRILAHLLSKCR